MPLTPQVKGAHSPVPESHWAFKTAKLDAVPMGLSAEAMQDDATELLSGCSGCRLTAAARS